MVGYLGGNVDRNVEIAGGIRIFFRKSGTANFENFGDVSDVSSNPLVEYVDFLSAQDGTEALAKKLTKTKGLAIEITANEVTPTTLQYAYGASAPVSGSINAPASDTPKRVGTTGGTYTLKDATIVAAISVRSEDGATVFTEGTHYSIAGNVLTDLESTGGSMGAATGDKIHVLYDVAYGAAQVMEILDDDNIEGAMQFQIINQDGGMTQILEIDSVKVEVTDTIDFSTDSNQSLSMKLTAQVVGGQIGRLYIK